nr:hypothetical protein GCM10020093_098490 [Planobispora longispora]
MLALVLARVRLRGPLRVVALALAWAAAFTLVVLVPDQRGLVALAYAPIFLVGLPWGWPDADYFATALPWPVLNLLICTAGGVLWAAAALAFQRRTGDRCESCGRSHDRAPSWTDPASAARWGGRAAYVAFVIPLFYAVVRWAWALEIPLLFSAEELRWLHESGLVWAGAGLATLAALGGVLTLGLAQRWGEVWPRWVIGLAGRCPSCSRSSSPRWSRSPWRRPAPPPRASPTGRTRPTGWPARWRTGRSGRWLSAPPPSATTCAGGTGAAGAGCSDPRPIRCASADPPHCRRGAGRPKG